MFTIKKKKGNTLIELIAAIAIIAICLDSVAFAVATSAHIWTSGDSKSTTSIFNQSISSDMQSKGRMQMKSIYDNDVDFPKSSGNRMGFYVYFNNSSEITTALNSHAINDAINQKEIIVDTHFSFDYATCKDEAQKANIDKKYGALVMIKDLNGRSEKYNSLYRVDVKVWDLKDSSNYEAASYFNYGGKL